MGENMANHLALVKIMSEELSADQRIARCEMLLKLILVIQFPQLYGLL